VTGRSGRARPAGRTGSVGRSRPTGSTGPAWIVAVDTGGTYTDAVAISSDGLTRVAKVPSTPADPGLAFERAGPRRQRCQLVVRAPVEDLDAVLESLREHQRHVDGRDPSAAAIELRPERAAVEPVDADPAQPHLLCVPLQVVVDAVLARVRRRVEGRPDRPGQEVRRGAERVQRPARQGAREVREHAEIRAPEIVKEQRSSDGTRKWLLKVDEANAVEAVVPISAPRGLMKSAKA
jgi:hypothetical protein